MNPDPSNPYAPPQTIPAQQGSENPHDSLQESLKDIGAIPFEGAVTASDLEAYLRADGHVGCARLMFLAIGFGAILLLLPMLGLMFATIACGLAGILVIVLTTSTAPYRRLMFINSNPDWHEPIRGSINADGIEISRRYGSSFYQWNWYGEAIASENVLALVPATQPGTPLLITRAMIANSDWWNLVTGVSEILGREFDNEQQLERRRHENLRILKNGNRDWASQAPEGAIAFEGIVWSDDWSRLPETHRIRQRPLRTYVIIYGLIASAGLVMAGCSGLLFDQVALLPILVGMYVLIAIAWGRRRRAASREVIFYLRGYASESCLTTDFGLAVSETAWPGLEAVSLEDRHVVLQRVDQSNFIVIRQDMFADPPAWQRFLDLARRKLA